MTKTTQMTEKFRKFQRELILKARREKIDLPEEPFLLKLYDVVRDAAIECLEKCLQYDRFVKKHGFLSTESQAKFRFCRLAYSSKLMLKLISCKYFIDNEMYKDNLAEEKCLAALKNMIAWLSAYEKNKGYLFSHGFNYLVHTMGHTTECFMIEQDPKKIEALVEDYKSVFYPPMLKKK